MGWLTVILVGIEPFAELLVVVVVRDDPVGSSLVRGLVLELDVLLLPVGVHLDLADLVRRG
jgi:hypothetical protein